MKTGTANLPLHWGKAPKWLFERMTKLAREITIVIVDEYGPEEMLKRLSDPYWFQAIGCVLGYDWHSSGLTTTTCAAIKLGIKGIEKELGFFVAGGKGRTSRKTPHEIRNWAEKVYIRKDPEKLVYASKMSAKVDSSAIQDGYQLYHHNFFFTKSGAWTVIQQGMPATGYDKVRNRNQRSLFYKKRKCKRIRIQLPLQNYARRYHWFSENIKDFVHEPKTNICDNKKYQKVLNLTSAKSTNAKEVIHDISLEKPKRVLNEYKKIISLHMPKREWIESCDMKPEYLKRVLLSTYERQPANFEELLGMKGIGPKSIRALTLVSELTYGTKADWNDPVKYSFAHGGKDGYPYPVDKVTYDKSIEFLKKAIKKARLGKREKRNCLRKLI